MAKADLDEAIAASERAWPEWRSTDVEKRGAILHKAADLLKERADHIAAILTQEQGKPLQDVLAAQRLDMKMAGGGRGSGFAGELNVEAFMEQLRADDRLLHVLLREAGRDVVPVDLLGHGTALISVATTEVFASAQPRDRASSPSPRRRRSAR